MALANSAWAVSSSNKRAALSSCACFTISTIASLLVSWSICPAYSALLASGKLARPVIVALAASLALANSAWAVSSSAKRFAFSSCACFTIAAIASLLVAWSSCPAYSALLVSGKLARPVIVDLAASLALANSAWAVSSAKCFAFSSCACFTISATSSLVVAWSICPAYSALLASGKLARPVIVALAASLALANSACAISSAKRDALSSCACFTIAAIASLLVALSICPAYSALLASGKLARPVIVALAAALALANSAWAVSSAKRFAFSSCACFTISTIASLLVA